MFDWFQKMLPINALYVTLVQILSWKKACHIYIRMFEFNFPREDVID